MPALFLTAFVLGAGSLALWVDVRFPKLAPQAFSRRVLAAAVALGLLSALPVSGTMVGMLGCMLPALTLALLTTLWLLRVAADPQAHL